MVEIPTLMVDIINDIRSAIGRGGVFTVLDSTTECPVCDLDPNTGTSTDSFCPVCSGLHYIPEYSEVTITGHVSWGVADDTNYYSAGQVPEGDCRFQIGYTEYNLDIVERMVSVVIDNRRLELDKQIPRGVPQLNRLILILDEEEKENG